MNEKTILRFCNKIEKNEVTGCWDWVGGTTSGHGEEYGRVCIDQEQILAHRVAWTMANGPISQGMNVLHKCDNPLCVNPSHLFLGTQLDNATDKYRKGRANILQGSKRFYSGEIWLIYKLMVHKLPAWFVGRMFKCTERTIFYINKANSYIGKDGIKVMGSEVLT